MSAFKHLSNTTDTRTVTKTTPQTQAIPGREAEMAQNNGGGFSFILDNWSKLDRFLIIGTESATLNLGQAAGKQLTQDFINLVKQLLNEDGNKVVDRCVEISQAGRARDNDYALMVMALAMTYGGANTKRYAGSSLHLVARTGTHLMHFVGFVNGMRGWGKALKKSVQNWYGRKTADQVAFQAVKYQSRDGWSQRDILRLSHPKAGEDVLKNNVYKYITKGVEGLSNEDAVPKIITAFEQAKTADKGTLIKLITDHNLTHEMIPNDMKKYPEVWEALGQNMGTTALIRNLNKMTAVGLIKPFSQFSKLVVERLNDEERIRKDRVHPLQMFIAMRTYQQGHGDKGSLVWTPASNIVQGLEAGFYGSFKAVEPTGKNMMLALDVSGSMTWTNCSGASLLQCAEGAVIMAMVTARTERNSAIFGFSDQLRDLKITANDTLESATKKTYTGVFGSTNCAAPMEFALKQRWDIDSFVVYTDNDTNSGRQHPSQALKKFRTGMNKHDAKLIVCGMAASGFTIADPKDRGMLDVVGFDSASPQFISAFAAGRL